MLARSTAPPGHVRPDVGFKFFLSGIEGANGILFIHFPIVELAALAARSTMTVKRSLNELEGAGLILRECVRASGTQQNICTHSQEGGQPPMNESWKTQSGDRKRKKSCGGRSMKKRYWNTR